MIIFVSKNIEATIGQAKKNGEEECDYQAIFLFKANEITHTVNFYKFKIENQLFYKHYCFMDFPKSAIKIKAYGNKDKIRII